ncbi:MAG TPA: hypothetical protein VHW45_03305 [Candidatus Sulfotelmatobacter sp.]|nr:hypothetical protein [Candidatus Sulfotelmatobacter sp.]
MQDIRRTGVIGWTWVGLTPDGNPLILRDTGTEEIYPIDVDLPRVSLSRLIHVTDSTLLASGLVFTDSAL